jgi:pyrimidine-nucleoside phosphorylase
VIPSRVVRRKRDGYELTREELGGFLEGFQSGAVADYQMAAFLMAVHFQGLSPAELDILVDRIIESGSRVDFGGIPGHRVDKHSTGGVGDKVSLVLAPLAASLGVQVPMMSGRGLGHSGGTVDKLESIPGFRVDLSLDAFRAQVIELGVALISQTPEIAPLDGRLYALRDVTATVDSIPLIASSIMSKKIAEGIDGLVLDVKTGNGAFLPEEDRALELARSMVAVGKDHGLEVVALLTAMDRPLGRTVGNALEVAEALDVLRGGGPPDLRAVTVALAAEMLMLADAAGDRTAVGTRVESALDDGRALAVFRDLVQAQGGDPAVIDHPDRLPRAPVRGLLEADRGGCVVELDTRAVGEAAMDLGAGRATLEEEIDPRVGFVFHVEHGSEVDPGDPLVEVHAADEASAGRALGAIRAAIRIGEPSAVGPRPLISHRVTGDGVERLA